jgi:general secretion pathway protein D
LGHIFHAIALSLRANITQTDKQKGRPSVMKRYLAIPALALLLSACSNAPIQPPSDSHLRAEKVGAGDTATIPSPVQQTLAVPKPRAVPKVETYSVVVNNVRVQELLFALARDAKLNVDIHPGIEGIVTLNAIDQTLQQLLTRISKQVDIRWELDGPNLSVMPDKPFLRNYKIDFVNMSRTVKSDVSTSTQIASASTGAVAGASAGAGGNTASTSVVSETKNDLMKNLVKNVYDILLEEDRIRYDRKVETQIDVIAKTEGTGQISAGVTDGTKTRNADGSTEASGPGGAASGSGNQKIDSRAEAGKRVGTYEKSNPVFANLETGIMVVRATSHQHEKVQQFIDLVMRSAKRQVLLEATIVEVNLSNSYTQGIDWKKVSRGLVAAGTITGNSIAQAATGLLTMSTTNSGGTFNATVNLLEEFGNVKVLSSPKLSVMNNQTATLKVADSKVYFEMKAETSQNNGSSLTTYTTTPKSVNVGFFMNVTPQVSDNDEVTINVRPTITRITGYANDPNPSLAAAGVTNPIPEIRTREMESIIKVGSGQIAVMGGLMQEELNNNTGTVPGLVDIPILGNLFKSGTTKRAGYAVDAMETSNKTELVIFLRPVVIKDASIEGDFSEYRQNLPGQDFFGKNYVGPQRQQLDLGGTPQ